jgi:hypothetical protein
MQAAVQHFSDISHISLRSKTTDDMRRHAFKPDIWRFTGRVHRAKKRPDAGGQSDHAEPGFPFEKNFETQRPLSARITSRKCLPRPVDIGPLKFL